MKKDYTTPTIEIIIIEDIYCNVFGSNEYGDTEIDYNELFNK